MRVGALLSLTSAAVQAQGAPSPYAMRPGQTMVGAWVGASPSSPTGFLGYTPDRQFGLVGLRYGWVVEVNELTALEYVFDLIPAAVVTNNPITSSAPNGAYTTGNVLGFGFAPLGVQVHLLPKNRLRWLLGASAGALRFAQPVPLGGSRQLNYTVDAGVGAEFAIDHCWVLAAGYKFHHLSSFEPSIENPGLNANIFHIGVRRSR